MLLGLCWAGFHGLCVCLWGCSVTAGAESFLWGYWAVAWSSSLHVRQAGKIVGYCLR